MLFFSPSVYDKITCSTVCDNSQVLPLSPEDLLYVHTTLLERFSSKFEVSILFFRNERSCGSATIEDWDILYLSLYIH
jgi:hypothetical protein